MTKNELYELCNDNPLKFYKLNEYEDIDSFELDNWESVEIPFNELDFNLLCEDIENQSEKSYFIILTYENQFFIRKIRAEYERQRILSLDGDEWDWEYYDDLDSDKYFIQQESI